MILHTIAGDIVLAFYPDVAPKHMAQILKLAREGAYDTTHFHRIESGSNGPFVAQISNVQDRVVKLTPEQEKLIHKIPGEFSSIKHKRGILSMARWGDPKRVKEPVEDLNSAETSFSIILGGAAHLDEKYTVFGHVERGMEVVDEFFKVPREKKTSRPKVRLQINSAEVLTVEELKTREIAAARAVPFDVMQIEPDERPAVQGPVPKDITIGIAVMVMVGLLSFLASNRFQPRVVYSLYLINILIGAFLLFAILAPTAQSNPWFATGLFIGILSVIKLMSHFESPA